MRIKKKIGASVAAIAMTALMACSSATPAFAQANDPDANSNPVVVEESTEETTENKDAADASADSTETDDTRDVSGALTPDGSLTLVDDVDGEASEDMQFMTVTTRDGSYYYIIIDRSGSEDNVYFLNAVDAVDLMNLMSDDEKAEFTDTEEETTENVVTPIVTDDQDQTEAEDDEDIEEEAETEKSNNMPSSFPILCVFLAIGAAIAGAYYMLKIKPKKGQGSIDEDREFYDDEDYENEDEPELEEDEDSEEEEE